MSVDRVGVVDVLIQINKVARTTWCAQGASTIPLEPEQAQSN